MHLLIRSARGGLHSSDTGPGCLYDAEFRSISQHCSCYESHRVLWRRGTIHAGCKARKRQRETDPVDFMVKTLGEPKAYQSISIWITDSLTCAVQPWHHMDGLSWISVGTRKRPYHCYDINMSEYAFVRCILLALWHTMNTTTTEKTAWTFPEHSLTMTAKTMVSMQGRCHLLIFCLAGPGNLWVISSWMIIINRT